MIRLSETYDYTGPEFDRLVQDVSLRSTRQISRQLKQLQRTDIGAYLALGTAAQVAASRETANRVQEYLAHGDTELRLFVIQPMFREGLRLLSRSPCNPHGEDALRFKLSRFDAIAAHFSRIHFTVVIVDDGCDGGGNPGLVSSDVARSIVVDYYRAYPRSRVRAEVHLLCDLMQQASSLGWNAQMTSAEESRKGGSVLAGLAYSRRLTDNEITSTKIVNLFIDYDADLSIHPDQIMLLAEKVVMGGYLAAVASRRCEGAISYIDPERDHRGRVYIKRWQAMLPALASQISDVNRGLKVYSRSAIDIILDNVQERTFPYQVECLLALILKSPAVLAEVPVSYIDSVALSTQVGNTAVQSYDDQLQRIRQMAVRYGQIQ